MKEFPYGNKKKKHNYRQMIKELYDQSVVIELYSEKPQVQITVDKLRHQVAN